MIRHAPARYLRGFTLIELMVALALLATLAAAVLPAIELTARRSREQQLRQSLRDIRRAIDAYKQAADEGRIEKRLDESGYPPNLEVLESGVPDKKKVSGGAIYFLRRLPRDPTCDCADTPAAQTWRLRSYDSAFDAPQAGADVFDVSSMSDEKGLNGIPYDQW
jgi:general secretion pathway protein G